MATLSNFTSIILRVFGSTIYWGLHWRSSSSNLPQARSFTNGARCFYHGPMGLRASLSVLCFCSKVHAHQLQIWSYLPQEQNHFLVALLPTNTTGTTLKTYHSLSEFHDA
ncbi:unnamed protein product [Sphenostylis stenocarpa]|uniref:Uncharacterized protein n=1 Tax=Sphenostylis stenocarpa TaxID=92480 RepID=A0AA86SDD7_9FABA|nr:unnamed protein product [Sphenostylis stenocarpa]